MSRVELLDSVEDIGPRVLRRLRRSLAVIIGAIPRVSRAVDLTNRLSIDRSLGWKVWKVAHGPDAYPSPKHIPGHAGMEIFLRAAEKAGVSAPLVEEARLAFAEFEQVMNAQAGDRATADILLGALAGEGREQLELQLRREAFRANSYLLGAQARTLYRACVVLPAQTGCMPDVALVQGFFGLRRMRPATPWLLSRSVLVQQQGPVSDYTREPLCEAAARGEEVSASQFSGADAPLRERELTAPLVTDFCNPRVLPVRRRIVANVVYEDELAPGPIGESGAVDIVLAERVSNIQREEVSRDAVTMRVSTPSERVCFDVLLHESVLGSVPPVLEVLSTVHGDLHSFTNELRVRLPMTEPLIDYGPATLAPPVPEVARQIELLEWLFRRIGHAPSEFRAFRVLMRYPPIPICLAVTYGLALGLPAGGLVHHGR